MIYKNLKILALLIGGILLLSGCMDLQVDNPNNPDTERALASAADTEALVGSQFQEWWNQQKNYPAMTLAVMGNHKTSSWGNFGMFDLGAYPRQAFQNDPSYADRFMSSTPWSVNYAAISSSIDGIVALDTGIMFASNNDERRLRMEAFSRFIMGISYGMLANHFDKAFLVDETTDFEAIAGGTVTLDFSPYDEVLDFALAQLDEAIRLSESGAFTLEESWINGNALSNTELAMLARAYQARFIVSNARSTQERDAINWARVRDLTATVLQEDPDFFNNRHDAFTVHADGQFWWSRPHSLMQDATWTRVDYMLIGHTDTSGEFESWVNTPVTDRRQFVLTTPDARIAGQEDVFNEDGELTGEAMRTAPGTDFSYSGPAAFPAARGLWRHSMYQHFRNNEMYLNGFVGPMQHMRITELKMYHAEALLRLDQAVSQPVVDLINETRVGRGGLEPVTTADSWDDVYNAMRYEFGIETHSTAAGLDFYNDRSFGNLKGKNYGALLSGTPLHFPVPAAELSLLELAAYTFGGGGEGSAPKGISSELRDAQEAASRRYIEMK